MLNLIFAPSADHLVPLAVERIRGAWTDPFDPPAIIVPNPAVGKWLRVRLIEEPDFECIAGARVVTLERFLWDALGGGDAKMLDAGELSQAICALLDGELLAMDIYEPLRNYLCGNDGTIDALKRVQLSTRVAQQFLEYEYNRPSVWNDEENRWRRHGIDARWLAGKEYFDGGGHEPWQMDLYRRTYKILEGTGAGACPLPHLYRRRREECAATGRRWCDIGSNPQVFLFGVSKISHFHRNTLVEISQTDGVGMHVFLTNPCAEFWEDVDTSRRSFRRRWSHNSPPELAGIKPVKPADYDKPELDMFADAEDHALLKLWGGAGKENIFLWCPQAEWNFDYHGYDDVNEERACPNASPSTSAQNEDTLLKAIQRSLLLRKNDLGISDDKLKDDGSIQILACPDISREVEEVREQILDMAFDGTIKTFDDVAVYIPDPNKYLPYIQRVFGAHPMNHPKYIPFTILGAPGTKSLTARGLFALLDIINGQFNRARIFELLENPIVRSTKNISSRDVETWAGWAEEFGMFRGYDAAQRKSMGDMGDAITEEHTFTHGLRLASSVVEGLVDTASPTTTVLPTTKDSQGAPVPTIKVVCRILEELNDLALLFARTDGGLDIRESVETVRRAIWAWFGGIPADGSVNGGAEARVRGAALEGLDRILLQHTPAGREKMPLDEFIALVRGCVPEDTEGGSSAWNGITFAPLKASMALPHRAIFAIGLGAADFPGTNEKGSWDLLSRRRIVGDSDRVRDNRFAFLELIHAAKVRLVLSYRARDMQKDEPLQPSSVILELEEYLAGQGLTDGKRRCLIRRDIPWVVYESLDTARREHGTWDETQRELAALSTGERVKHRHDLFRRGKAADGEPDNTAADQYYANIRDIKLFLKNPLEYHLCRTLGIYGDEERDMSAVNEPVESGYRLYGLRRKVWAAVFDMIFSRGLNGGDLTRGAADSASAIYDEHVESGHAPEGHIRRAEKDALIKWTETCVTAAAELTLRFPNHQPSEACVFSFESGSFAVSGEHALILTPRAAGAASLKTGVAAFTKDKDDDPTGNPGLWLDGAARALYEIGNGGAGAVSLVMLGHGDEPAVRVTDMNISADDLGDIEKWLIGILTQMLIEKRCEHLPFRAIKELIMTNPKKRGKSSGRQDAASASANNKKRLLELTPKMLREYMFRNPYRTYTEGFDLTDARPSEMNADELRETILTRYAPMFKEAAHE